MLRFSKIGKLLLARNFAVNFTMTPNPLCLKVVSDRQLTGFIPGTEYRSIEEAKDCSLSSALLSVDGIQKLMMGTNFVSVTKKEAADWEVLKPKITEIIDNYVDSGVKPDKKIEEKSTKGNINPSELEAISMIRELIEFRIRPMLLDDGGDIEYRGFNPRTGVLL